jgi:hypothetical protein
VTGEVMMQRRRMNGEMTRSGEAATMGLCQEVERKRKRRRRRRKRRRKRKRWAFLIRIGERINVIQSLSNLLSTE